MVFFSAFLCKRIRLLFLLSSLFLFACPVLQGARVNKTKYIPPGREKIRQILSLCKKKADNAPEKDYLCVRQELIIEIYMDYSCKIAETKEFYLKKDLKENPFRNFESNFVEQYFPGGLYKASYTPERLFLPADSLLILKSSRFLPPRKAEEFFLELYLDHPYRVLEKHLTVACTRNQKINHGMIPPYSGRLPRTKQIRKNIYILNNIPPQKGEKNDERLRFYVSSFSSWHLLGDFLLAKLEKAGIILPPLPEINKNLSPYKKAEFLYEKAKKSDIKSRGYILYKWLNQAGIKANMAMARDNKSIPLTVPCNFFTKALICIREQKGFHGTVFLDPACEKMGETHFTNSRFAVLVLEKKRSFIMFENSKGE